jgi:hypothetical protein
MRINSSGNVGIGTDSPTSKLQSQTSSSGSTPNMLSLVNNTGGAANATGVKLWMSGRAAQADADRGTYIESVTTDTNNAHAMAFATSASGAAPTERMRILSTGQVGVGTTNPLTKFAVSNSGANGFEVAPDSDSGNETKINSYNRSTAAFTSMATDASQHRWLTAGTERMRIASGGNVLVGSTVDNGFKFKVVGGNSSQVLIDNDGSRYTQLLLQRNATANSGGDILIDGTNATMSMRMLAVGAMTFNTSASAGDGVERMRIDTSGNVGINTTSAGVKLGVVDTSAGAATFPAIFGNRGTTVGTQVNIGLQTYDSGSSGITNVIGSVTTSATGGAGSADMVFLTTASATRAERMRIDSSGNLLVGQTSQSNSEKFGVVSSNAGAAIYGRNTTASGFAAQFVNSNATGNNQVAYLQFSGQAPNNTTAGFLYCNDSSTLRAHLYSNGGLANFSGNNVNLSDAREKTNIELAGSYLDKMCAIPVKTFNYINQNREEDDGLTLGVIAQDVQVVAPELITESNWGTEEEPKMRLSIYQTDLQYALMKCIQEQQALIENLTTRLNALEGK